MSLVWATPNAEESIAYCARVSSPHQDNPEYAKLLKYLVEHKHWSPFEMASMCVEIVTSRAISQQIIRHRSFSYQEFSQRYAEAVEVVTYPGRRQAEKNRQSSIDDMPADDQLWFYRAQKYHAEHSLYLYQQALDRGFAKECARVFLPLATQTRLYMTGTLRSWIHYLQVRLDPTTQLEHREIADDIAKIFADQFPIIAEVTNLG